MEFDVFAWIIYACGFTTGILVIIITNLIKEDRTKQPRMKKWEKLATSHQKI